MAADALDLGPPATGPDDSALPDDALVRYQWMQATRGIGGNHRFVLFDDGRLHATQNEATAPAHLGQRFDTPLPAEPTTTLPPDEVDRVRDLLAASDLATDPPEVERRMRDGHMVVVTARIGDTVHEVSYRNADTPLVTELANLHHELMGDGTATLEELAAYFGIEDES